MVEKICEPVCYTGLKDEKGVIVFNEEFTQETITELIYNIENLRQSESYKCLDLYFSSPGGELHSMYRLIDYLNNLEGLDINLIVDGEIASAGFYTVFLLEDVNVIFNEACYGMIHLGDTYISVRGQLDKTAPKYSWDKFHKNHMNNMNNKFKNFILELGLTDKEKKHILCGKDLFLHKEKLEKLYDEYRNKKFYSSDEAIQTYITLKEQQTNIQKSLKEMEKNFIKYSNIDITKELGL